MQLNVIVQCSVATINTAALDTKAESRIQAVVPWLSSNYYPWWIALLALLIQARMKRDKGGSMKLNRDPMKLNRALYEAE